MRSSLLLLAATLVCVTGCSLALMAVFDERPWWPYWLAALLCAAPLLVVGLRTRRAAERVVLRQFHEDMNGHDYETFLRRLAEASGWDAQVTRGSGDQGVDVIAVGRRRKGGPISVAIQAKRLARNVTNKAVQEVTAGMNHYGTDHALVVSNAAFTASAYALAASNRVDLIHHTELVAYLRQLEKGAAGPNGPRHSR